jgi:hypothetical protein
VLRRRLRTAKTWGSRVNATIRHARSLFRSPSQGDPIIGRIYDESLKAPSGVLRNVSVFLI